MAKRQPKKSEPKTYEEFLAVEWEHFRLHHGDEEAIVPEVNYHFAVGEDVRYELSNLDKQAFFDNMVQVATLDAEYVKKSDILWLFLSVNRGGVPQTEEHITKAQALYEKALESEKK